MKNVTISLDPRTLEWVRREAAARGMSLSRFIGASLEESMADSMRYGIAMHAFLNRAPWHFEGTAAGYPTRDELHARADLR